MKYIKRGIRTHREDYIPASKLELTGSYVLEDYKACYYKDWDYMVFENDTTEYRVELATKRISRHSFDEKIELKEKYGITNKDWGEIIRIYCIANQREFCRDPETDLFYSDDWSGFVETMGWGKEPMLDSINIGAKWGNVIMEDYRLTTWSPEDDAEWVYLPKVIICPKGEHQSYFI